MLSVPSRTSLGGHALARGSRVTEPEQRCESLEYPANWRSELDRPELNSPLAKAAVTPPHSWVQLGSDGDDRPW